MLATPSHHTFHRLNRLITTFLAQMRHVPAPVENPVSISVKQPGTDDQSNATTDSTQVAPELTIDQAALPHQAPALSSVPAERDDGRTKGIFVGAKAQQEQLSGASTAEYAKRCRIRCKKAFLVINPRAGHNVTRIADVLAVLSAAGWKTGIAVKQYGGHTIELATRAAEQGYDLVVAYGGDGTINHVVNGVMGAKGKGRRKAVGVDALPKTSLLNTSSTIGSQSLMLSSPPTNGRGKGRKKRSRRKGGKSKKGGGKHRKP